MKICGKETHPLSDASRLLVGSEFDNLVDDVKKNGLLEEIELYEDMILDGRNRGRACEEAGIEPRFRIFEGDPLLRVISKNHSRRHDNESQRAIAAAKLATLVRGGDRRSKRRSADKSRAAIARELNVGERTVDQAAAVLARGIPDVVAAIDAGDLSVWKASELVELPKVEQGDALELALAQPKRKPANDERDNSQSDPARILLRSIVRTLTQLGATVKKVDAESIELAFHGARWAIALQRRGEAEKAA